MDSALKIRINTPMKEAAFDYLGNVRDFNYKQPHLSKDPVLKAHLQTGRKHQTEIRKKQITHLQEALRYMNQQEKVETDQHLILARKLSKDLRTAIHKIKGELVSVRGNREI